MAAQAGRLFRPGSRRIFAPLSANPRVWYIPSVVRGFLMLKRCLLFLLAMSFLLVDSGLAQESRFQPWNASRRGSDIPGFAVPELRGRPQHPISRSRSLEEHPEAPVCVLRRASSPRLVVDYPTSEAPGTIVIDTKNTVLYLVTGGGKALRYEIGVGREGFTWAGRERISRMAEWPDWRPPPEMLDRDPSLPRHMSGGLNNPLGARALYLGNTLYRIHGTNQPASIGTFESSGCFRMLNDDVIDLYQRVSVGTQVVVLGHDGIPPRTSRPSFNR